MRQRALGPLYGRYLYGDLCSREIRSLIPRTNGASDDRPTGLTAPGALMSFGTDARRNVYVVAGESIYRIVAE